MIGPAKIAALTGLLAVALAGCMGENKTQAHAICRIQMASARPSNEFGFFRNCMESHGYRHNALGPPCNQLELAQCWEPVSVENRVRSYLDKD
jgi:hypothetical protein